MQKPLLLLAGAGVLIALSILFFSSSDRPEPVVANGDNAGSSSPETPTPNDLRTVPDDTNYRRLMQQATEGTGKTNAPSPAGRALTERTEPSELSFRELEAVFDRIEGDAAAGLSLMERVLEEPEDRWNGLEHQWLLHKAGALAVTVEPASLTQRIESFDSDTRRSLFTQGAAEALTDLDVNRGIDWIAALEDETLKTAAIYGVSKSWAKQDRMEAFQWLESLEDEASHRQAINGLVAGWALTEPEDAFQYANVVQGESRSELIVEAAAAIYRADPKKASQWATRAEYGTPELDLVLEESVMRWADQEFNVVSEWAATLPHSGMRDKASVALVHSWSQNEPRDATEWANNYPTSHARNLMLQRSFLQWGLQDPEAAASWIQEQPVDIEHLGLLRRSLEVIIEQDPSLAQPWQNALTKPEIKGFMDPVFSKPQNDF